MNTPHLPTLYISHGSPMTGLEPGVAGDFWRALGPAWDRAFGRPRAILAVSAHSLTREPVLMGAAEHETVHDFYGFPAELYRVEYPAQGSPELAQRAGELLTQAGLPSHVLPEGGLDHGIWVPLRFMYPEVDIPIVPLAWPPNWSPTRLRELGQALAPLTEEGVMIVGSGGLTHNLRLFSGGFSAVDAPERPDSAAFRQWFSQHVADAQWSELDQYRSLAPYAAAMHPTDEHLLPIYVAAGAAGGSPKGVRLHDSVTYGHLGMDTFAFGERASELTRALTAQAQPTAL